LPYRYLKFEELVILPMNNQTVFFPIAVSSLFLSLFFLFFLKKKREREVKGLIPAGTTYTVSKVEVSY